ncbi:MAG TPA: hypothetical protein PLJ42_00870 [Chitinophagales bacterium]|jgi:hypothetical protein|nr:hypothetical protein [Chitinophagales bacterium]HQW77953.1 hypothetical protein [Chitinophagales bacterium]HRB19450.1 hypothetical protein [Chitinophagales bacterium]HRB67219.1 hypothetical protein [Chitinophagales bacterium]HRB69294.1 hypothetical protein [Chitinophagales bacterium]
MFLGIFTNTEDVFANQFLFLNDLFFAPIYMYIWYSIVKKIADKYYKNTIHYEYLMNAFKVKAVCCILFVLVFVFYYGGGDTFAYLCNVMQLKDYLLIDPVATYNMLFRSNSFEAHYVMDSYMLAGGSYLTDDSSRIVIMISFFLSFICMSSYLSLCIFYAAFCMIGGWKLYKTFVDIYPHLHKEIAIACLFIPSVCFWGGGQLKDPICMGFIGIFTNAVYESLLKGRNIASNIFLIIISVYAIMQIKVYIILAFAPAVAIWVFSRYRYRITSPFIKAIIGPVMMIGGGALSILILTQMGKVAERYSFEEMMRTAQDTQNWLITSSKMAGSTSFYTLGDIDFSLFGMLKVFPNAVNVALFRPYFWEAKKPILFLSALEGAIFFFITIRQIFKAGFFGTLKQISNNPEVQFCLIFSIIFAFAVGFTSFNFGALARYKIPYMPFYLLAFFILADSTKKLESTKK